MSVETVTPPTGDIIELADAKAHLRIPESITLFDDDVSAKLAASTAYAEQILSRALLTQTLRLWLDCWPKVIRLPGGKPQSITSVMYTDTTGTVQTLDPSLYQTDAISEEGRVVPAHNTCWPTLKGGINQVQVQYVVGYGEPADVPAPIIQAIKLILGDAWVNREAALDSRFYVINQAADNLLWPYRIVRP